MAKIAVLGYGVVGSGTVEVFYKNKESLEKKAGQEMDIKYILDVRDFNDSPYKDKFVKDFNVILNDPEVTVVAEVIGGLKPSYDFVKSSLEAGKSVVTSNKELVAAKGAELLAIAKEKNVNFFFEASVGGGIPIIRPLKECLAGNEITEVMGIVNGTTNYILTKMFEDGMDFTEALAKATELGYAEADPTADVEGLDAGRKVAIMATSAFHSQVKFSDVYTEGITKITAADVNYAKEMGNVIKLIGIARNTSNGIEAGVYPMMIDKKHPLATVRDSFNAVFVHGDAVGDTMFYGRGAGKLPTASAVVSDVVDEVKHMGKNIMASWDAEALPIGDFRDAVNRFFIRVRADAITKDEIQKLFGDVTYVTAEGVDGELAFITSSMTEGSFADITAKIDKIFSIIRVAF